MANTAPEPALPPCLGGSASRRADRSAVHSLAAIERDDDGTPESLRHRQAVLCTALNDTMPFAVSAPSMTIALNASALLIAPGVAQVGGNMPRLSSVATMTRAAEASVHLLAVRDDLRRAERRRRVQHRRRHGLPLQAAVAVPPSL